MKIWKYKRLSECSNFVSERTSNIAIDNYISTENMIENRGGVKEAAALPDVKSTSAYKPNDILLSNIRPYFCKIWFADKKGSCSNDVLVVRAKKEIDSKFLYYVLSDQNFFNWDSMTSKGTKMPRGTPNAIMKYSVPDIPLPTQKKIASILSAYDNLIQNYKKQIEALQTAASELYKEWFVRFRFPGYQTTQFENGIPVGWKVALASEVGEFVRGKNITADEMVEGTIPVISAGIEPSGYHNESNVDGVSLTISNSGANAGYLMINYSSIWAADCSYCNTAKSIYFYYEMLNNLRVVLFNLQKGAAQPHVYAKDINKMKVLLPPEDLVQKANEKISLLHKKIYSLQQQITNLIQQRDLLLPRLMSGKLEIK